MRLRGKVAFITGASSGIGAVMARRFAEQGARVVIAARRQDEGEAVAAAIRGAGGEAAFCRVDIADEDQVRAGIDFAVRRYGTLNVLVNNAGPVDLLKGGADRPVHEQTTQGFDRIMKVAIYGPFWCCKYALPHMLEAGGGSIVNVCSIAAVTGLPGLPAYSAAKGALAALTRQLAFDYGRHRIRANAIITGFVLHEGTAGQVDTAAKRDTYRARQLTRLGTADDIAYAALYLAADESEFVTGTQLTADGGMLVKSRPDPLPTAPQPPGDRE